MVRISKVVWCGADTIMKPLSCVQKSPSGAFYGQEQWKRITKNDHRNPTMANIGIKPTIEEIRHNSYILKRDETAVFMWC